MKKILILILLLNGCIYYNTFYNAEKYYQRGIEQKEEGKSGSGDFQKSIEKCKKVLTRYNESGWVDDALFLMGKNYYELNQYNNARTNFERIIDSYRNSPFEDESLLYLGKIALANDELTESVLYLDRATQSEDKEVKMEAFKTKIAIHLKSDSPMDAIKAGNDFIERYGSQKGEVYMIMGSAYQNTGNIPRALEMYRKSYKEYGKKKPEKLIYRMAYSYMELDSLENALNTTKLEHNSDSIKILRGRILRKLGRMEEAEETLEFAENWRNSIGAIANYEMGLIEEEKGEFEEARKLFEKASNTGEFGEITEKASAKSEILNNKATLNLYETNKDSLKEGIDPSFLNFRIGEIYYLELEDIENGIKWYSNVYRDFPDSKYAAKSIFALLKIFDNIKHDTAEVRNLLDILKDNYQKTDYKESAFKLYNGYLPDSTDNK